MLCSKFDRLIEISLMMFVLLGCNVLPLAPAPTATSTSQPSPVPTVAPTATPVRTATTAPTITPVPLPTTPPRRLTTGAMIKVDPLWSLSTGGESYLIITNTLTTLDVVPVLVMDNHPLIAWYIREGEAFTLPSIGTGTYTFYYALGEDWDSTTNSFTRKAEYHRFADPMTYERILNPIDRIYTYTYWRFVPMGGSQIPSLPVIDRTQFPSLK